MTGTVNWYTGLANPTPSATAVADTPAVAFGKKAALAPDARIFGREEEAKVDWPMQLLLLPRTMALRCEDLGFKPEERAAIVKSALANDKTALAKMNVALNVFVELMGIYQEERQVVDARTGELLFIDQNGNLTTQHFYITNQETKKYAPNQRAMEMRSPWGVRPGVECRSASGTEMPQPGHYKKMVEQNFDDLLPRLRFLSDRLDPSEPDPNAMRPEHTAMYAENLKALVNDNHFRRKPLLGWLTEFLKKPVATWNGLD